jgi:hypothetical protein
MNVPFFAAFLDLSGIQQAIFFIVRVFLGIVAGLLGWLVGGPLVRLLHRLAFRRPAGGLPVFVGRLAIAVLVGFLVFWYFPIGGGGRGWGWGPGSGGGPGAGPGKGGTELDSGTGKGKGQYTAPENTARKPGKETLVIELIASKQYEPGSDRYYLVGGKLPALKLQEIGEILKTGEGRWGQVEIRIYANSVAEDHPAVVELKQLTERQGLRWVRPAEYLGKEKKIQDKEG